MKKIFLAIFCLLFGSVLLCGCSNNDENFQQKSYRADGEQIETLDIDIRDRKIEISLSTDDQIHIDYFESDKEFYDNTLSDEKVLTMSARTNKEWTDYIGGKFSADKNTISVQIPDGVLSTLVLSTTNKMISMPELTIADSVSLFSNGGDISFEKLNVGKTLTLKNKNGNIKGKISGNYEDYYISCEAKKGKSNLPTQKSLGTKNLSVFNNNGNIDIEFVNN